MRGNDRKTESELILNGIYETQTRVFKHKQMCLFYQQDVCILQKNLTLQRIPESMLFVPKSKGKINSMTTLSKAWQRLGFVQVVLSIHKKAAVWSLL